MQDIKTIGVIGHRGMVGGTVFKYFKQHGYENSTFGYSRSEQADKAAVNSSDIIFVCVPTPFDWSTGKFNGAIVESALSEIADGRIVVIKSTIPIGTTEALQAKYPNLKILFNPEFLSEASSDNDFNAPDRQFVGYTKESFPVAIQVLNLLPESAYGVIVPSKEAELLKYINNLHGALSVIEANHYYDVCSAEGLDYNRVIKAAEASKWVGAPMGRQYHNVNHKGFRGYGGKCFPKDVNAWIEYCKNKDIPVTLFEAVRAENKDILADQDLTEEDAEKK